MKKKKNVQSYTGQPLLDNKYIFIFVGTHAQTLKLEVSSYI